MAHLEAVQNGNAADHLWKCVDVESPAALISKINQGMASFSWFEYHGGFQRQYCSIDRVLVYACEWLSRCRRMTGLPRELDSLHNEMSAVVATAEAHTPHHYVDLCTVMQQA